MNEPDASDITKEPAANVARVSTAPTRVPGWKTTEFWMTTLGHAGLIFAAGEGALPAKYAAIAAALSQLAYNLSRGLSKANAAH